MRVCQFLHLAPFSCPPGVWLAVRCRVIYERAERFPGPSIATAIKRASCDVFVVFTAPRSVENCKPWRMINKPFIQCFDSMIAKGLPIALRRKVPSRKRRQFDDAGIALQSAPLGALVLSYHVGVGPFVKVCQQKGYQAPPCGLRRRTHHLIENGTFHADRSLEKLHVAECFVMLDGIHKFARATPTEPSPGVAARQKIIAFGSCHARLRANEPIRCSPSPVTVPMLGRGRLNRRHHLAILKTRASVGRSFG
jgi:hypothetical protein